MLALPQGLSLGPMPEALLARYIDDMGTTGTWDLTDALAAVAVTVSRSGVVGWFETTPGWEGVAMWRDGVHTAPLSLDLLLEELGAKGAVPLVVHGWFVRVICRPRTPRPRSAWRTLGLDQWLTSQGAYDRADPVEPGS